MAKAKLLGLVIDRQEIGDPEDYAFERATSKDELFAMFEDRFGPEMLEKFKRTVSALRSEIIDDMKVIEHSQKKRTKWLGPAKSL